MTCFEIAHHLQASDLWVSNPGFNYKPSGTNARDMRQKNERCMYSVCITHPLYIQLRKEYRLDLKNMKKAMTEMEEEEVSVEG